MTRSYKLKSDSPSSPQIPYEKELNPEQLRVVTAGEGPLLVLAGPGSGKTRTLTYRVAYLIEQGIPPEQILLVTFTVKAAREMLDRVERLLKYRPEGLWGGTFHHIGNLFLRRHAEVVGRTATFGILDEEDSKDLITSCLRDIKIDKTKNRLPQANVLGAIFSLAINTSASLEQIILDRYPQFSEFVSFVEQVHSLYRERKQKSNLMDYDDLLTEWWTLLRDHEKIRQIYGERFRYILVDEYQDTNRLQFEIIRQLTSFHRNVLVVGDDAQSIYAFRGAEIKNILEFPSVFPKTAIFRLETNYRSTPEILHLANSSIQLNQEQFQKELKSVKESGPLPAVVPLVDAKQQATFIAQRVLELREEGISFRDIAILFRARFHSAELELELAKRNIPYIVRGGVRFFEQAHIKDVLAYLRILVNPSDELAWQRVLRLQEGIGPVYARRVLEAMGASTQPFQELFKKSMAKIIPSRAQAGWKRFCKTMEGLIKDGEPMKAAPADALLVVFATGYEDYLRTHFEDSKDRHEDLEQLVVLATQYQASDRFLEDLTLREPFKGETIQGWKEPDEFLVLSTIHQAKGLEWSIVFIINLVEGQFPHPKSFDDSNALEEERRLFYVAVTRTRRELYLTYPLTRYSYDRGEVLMRPSRFLQELPDQLCETWRVSHFSNESISNE